MDHQRNGKRAGHDGGMAADRAFFQNHAAQLAAIFQQLARADVARDQHRVFRHRRPGVLALSGQDAQQAVRQIIQIMQALAQVGISHLFHPAARGGLFLFHRGLGREARLDILFHPAQPAARMGEHAVGFQHRHLFLVQRFHRQQVIDRHAQLAHGGAQPFGFRHRIIGHGVGDHHARLVQPDAAFGGPFLPDAAAEQHRLLVLGRHRLALAGEGAKLGHLGQHHGHDFQGIDLVIGILAGGLGLDHQHAKPFADPLDRHTKERGVNLFPGFRHEAKAALCRGIAGVHRGGGAGHAAHQAFAQLHAGLVDCAAFQTFGRTKLQRFGVAEQVDRTHLGSDGIRDQMGDPVKPLLPLPALGQGIAQAAQQLAAFGFHAFGHWGRAAFAGCGAVCRA